MKYLMCVSKDWKNPAFVYQIIDALPHDSRIIIGGNKVEQDMVDYAQKTGHIVEMYPLMVNKYGKLAEKMRNIRMIAEKPDMILAFHSFIQNSKVIKHCVDEARRVGIKTIVFNGKEEINTGTLHSVGIL